MTKGDLNTGMLSVLDSTTGAATTTGGGGKNSSGSSMSRGRIQYCLKIGQALKQVDRTLFQEWLNWCNQTGPLYTSSTDTHITTSSNNTASVRNSISTSILKEERENNRGNSTGGGGRMSTQLALTAWDYFEPRACDVHSATYSQVYTLYIFCVCSLCVLYILYVYTKRMCTSLYTSYIYLLYIY